MNDGKIKDWLPVGLIAAGCLFYWIGLPPLRQPWAAFVSAFFFSAAVYCPFDWKRRDYLRAYLVGCLLWLLLLQGIRLAYWPLYGGWLALSLYVAVYIPSYVAIARSLRSRFCFAFPFACAISWTGLELFRSYFATGFAACMLGHSQTPWPMLLDIASQFGTYGVSFMIVLSGASVCYLVAKWMERNCECAPHAPWGERFGSQCARFLVVFWLAFSYWNVTGYDRKIESYQPVKPLGRYLIVQENMPTQFEGDAEGVGLSFLRHVQLSSRSLASEEVKVDAVLWPESTFADEVPVPWLVKDPSLDYERDFENPEMVRRNLESIEARGRQRVARLATGLEDRPEFIVGATVVKISKAEDTQNYNAVLRIGKVPGDVQYYAKRHLVMFGEYIPILSSMFPDLCMRFGLPSASRGDDYVSWTTASGATVAPSICFEDVVPWFIQRQVQELSARGETPDLLINVTNDAWFRGSSILDHHLNNAICCAVENRRPFLVAANSGVSAWIDGSGRVVQSIPKMTPGTILAEPIPDGRLGLWQLIGDWPARMVCFIAFLPAVYGVLDRFRRRKDSNVR